MRYVVQVTLLGLAIIHLLPVMGVLGSERLSALYGVAIEDRNLQILMRHRAVLFGLIGGLQLAAIWLPALQLTAFALGWISVGSFLWLCASTQGYNAHLARVVIVDLVALALLFAGTLAYWMS